MAQEQVEEYLEAIYDIAGTEGSAKTTAIAKCLKVAPASVTEALQSLAEKNLVNYEPYRGASLTGEGKKIAETIKRRTGSLRSSLPMSCISTGQRCTTRHAGWNIRSRKTPRTHSAGCSTPRRGAPTGALLLPAPRESGAAANVSSKPVRLSLIQRNWDRIHCPDYRSYCTAERDYRVYPGRLQGRPAAF